MTMDTYRLHRCSSRERRLWIVALWVSTAAPSLSALAWSPSPSPRTTPFTRGLVPLPFSTQRYHIRKRRLWSSSRQRRRPLYYHAAGGAGDEVSSSSLDDARRRLELILDSGVVANKEDANKRIDQEQHAQQATDESTGKEEPLLPDNLLGTVALPPFFAPNDRAQHQQRLRNEVDLLRQLLQAVISDDVDKEKQHEVAISVLWEFWTTERGTVAANRLAEAEALIAQHAEQTTTGQTRIHHNPSSRKNSVHLQRAELILRDLIDTHSVFWTEPIYRLATIYYWQANFEDAEALLKMVLKIKPWHMGALSAMVFVLHDGYQDYISAREWSKFRFPSSSGRRRIEWAQRALTSARHCLESSYVSASPSLLSNTGSETLVQENGGVWE